MSEEPINLTVTVAAAKRFSDSVQYEMDGETQTAIGDLTSGVKIPAGATYLGYELDPERFDKNGALTVSLGADCKFSIGTVASTEKDR